MAKSQIKNYVFRPAFTSPAANPYPNTVALITANRKFIQEEAIAWMQLQVTNNIYPFAGYYYDTNKCRRDISYVLEAYLSDLSKSENRQTIYIASRYWENNVSQVSGPPEVYAHQFIQNLIVTYILGGAVYPSLQTTVTQYTNNNLIPESAGITAITTLSNIIINVFSNPNTIPALSSNRGYIKFPGYWTQKDLLLITNTSKNVILYNFADNTNSVEISYSPAYDSDFPGALNGADKITTVVFDIDTSSMTVTDSIQIFVEKPEQMVRLNPIATDAMERMKVGIPQSMLDADFEYGLQPTKWQAIGLMRNYPSIYEIPNSTQAVISVTTDASSGSGGVGSSLLTVTTLNSHGFSVNQPFTIKALANSVAGFSRAEGSFLVNSVLSANQFTYYAKSKVGSNNGDVLSTTYTQLRTGAFYTGAGVGTPSFSVYSNGTSGSITTRLIALSGSLYIGFTGTAPPVGAPITGTGIASGSQISAVNGSGGTVVQTTLSILANIGDNTIVVDSTTSIIPGLLVDRGDGVGVAVTSISSNSVTLSGALTSSITGSNQTYTNISATGGTGSGAVFSITRAGGTYSTAVTTNGQNYAVNDVLTVIGSNVGGATPANNVTIRVLSVAPLKSVATFDLTTLLGGSGYVDGSTYSTTSSGTGTGLTLQVTAPSGIVTGVTIVNAGSNYQVGSTITLTQPVGAVLTFDTLVAGTGYSSANSVATTTNGSGTGLTVDVIGDGGGGVLAVNIVSAGIGYAPGDTVTISAGNSNATFNVVSVSVLATVNILSIAAGGDIQSVSTSGTTLTAPSVSFVSSIAVNTATTAQIANSASLSYSAISSIIITFASNHGFVPGNTITVQITSTDVNAQLAAGAFFVEQVPTSNTLIYTARSAGAIANTLTGNVYARPDCFFIHRPFDGGVQLGTGGPAHGAQAIRMSKKYIRYQSGKGVMYNTGALFAPSYNLQSITASGTGIGSLITITTDDTDHGCQVGGGITISGVTTSGYNGQYTVFSVVTERVLTVVATSVLGSTVTQLGNPCQLSVRSWHGSTVRSGIFDDQNGMFWAYDGQRLSVTKRSSTFIIAGSINIAANSNLVTGVNSRFTQQLAQGDRIVIRGMTHIISSVISDTQMTVTPDYRGATNATNAKAAKTIDLTVAQTNFNLDPLNGSGPSGYNADVTKMQMIGIQHTWYGAGFIDFMLRGSEGNYVFAHRFRNSNYNTEAYMRSGNQPVRYEVINEGARDRLTRAILSSDTTLPLFNAFFFPTSGTVLIDSELISFTGNDGLNLLGCVRGASLSQFSAGSQRNFTGAPAGAHSQYAGVVLVSNTITPIISHWGSAFMIDGQFDNDRGYIFNYAATGLTVTGNPTTAFLMRLAPSVSDAQVGDLGERELLNRAQLLINSISCTSDPVASGGGAIIIQGILNPINYPVDPTNITWTTLNSAAAGGQPSFTQIANGGSVTWSGGASTSTATVQGAFTTTVTAKSFAPSSNTLTAIAFSPVTNSMNATAIKIAQTGSATSFASSISPTYVSALSLSRTDFLIPQTTLNSFSPAVAVGDILSATTYLTGGQTVVSITNNYVSLASVVYARIIMSAAANATSTPNPATPTSGVNNVVVTFTNAAANTYVNALSTARTDFLIPQTQYAAFTTNIVTGDALSVATYLTGGQTVVSVTQNYVTFSGVAYARVIMSAAASSTSPAQGSSGTSVTTVTVASSLAARYNTAISTSRSDFLITQSQLSSVSIANTDILSVATYLTGSQTISNIVANYCTISGTAYAQIIMSSVGNSTSAAGTGNTISITATSSLTATYSTALNTGRYDFLITDSSYSGSGIAVGDGLSLATFLTGSQTIQSITQSYVTVASVPYTRIVMSGVANSTSTSGAGNDKVITVTAAGSAATYSNTNYLFFTSSTWLASGAVLGTRIAASYTQFPAGTSVTAIATRTYGSTTVYRVTFTQASNATISAGGTPTFQFGAAYALPGEQVFSFVSNPGATDVLDLSGLKELTSTAIGGRGTFPNGPDVLAINVYKISGTQTTANVIVRWGEAQA
jgi:hypothetical protein